MNQHSQHSRVMENWWLIIVPFMMFIGLPSCSVDRKEFQLAVGDITFLTSPLTFDPSVIDIFTTLTSGAALLVAATVVKMSPDRLLAVLNKHRVSILQVQIVMDDRGFCAWALSSGSLDNAPTSFRSDHCVIMCWLVECTMIWVWIHLTTVS